MTYLVINDGKGALANRVAHRFYFPDSPSHFGDLFPLSELDKTNHHLGETVTHQFVWQHSFPDYHSFYEEGTYTWNTELLYVQGKKVIVVLSQNLTFEVKLPESNLKTTKQQEAIDSQVIKSN
jgi:hypothetical protein